MNHSAMAQISRFSLISGFSLIELMISIAVMAIGVSALLGLHGNLTQTRSLAQDQNQLISLGRMMTDRFVAADFADLGDKVKAPWSVPRFLDTGVPNNSPPLTGAELVGVASGMVRLPDIKVYVEYYRGLRADADLKGTATAGVPALIEVFESELATKRGLGQITDEIGSTDYFRKKLDNPLTRAGFRINPEMSGADPLPLSKYAATRIDVDDLILIRILIVTKDRTWTTLTAKRKEVAE